MTVDDALQAVREMLYPYASSVDAKVAASVLADEVRRLRRTIVELRDAYDTAHADHHMSRDRADAAESQLAKYEPVIAAAREWHSWYGSDDSASTFAAAEVLWAAIEALDDGGG